MVPLLIVSSAHATYFINSDHTAIVIAVLDGTVLSTHAADKDTADIPTNTTDVTAVVAVVDGATIVISTYTAA